MAKRNGNLDLTYGFLPSTEPLARLPQRFKDWEFLASNLPKLLMSDALHKTIDKMSAFPTSHLRTEKEYERAMVLLSFIGHAYVWGNKKPEPVLPKVLAKPWYEIAKELGRPPVLSYASYALNNWRKINPKLPIELGNIALLQNFHGGQDEEWFVLVHVAIEANASTALQAMLPALNAVKKQDSKSLVKHLGTMATTLQTLCQILDRMPERCDPYIYYHRVRPYIHGWKDNPSLPNGLLYEGVKEYKAQPQKFRGETGAQSSIIPTFDAILNIAHAADPLRIYLQEMRNYMPVAHRQFLETIEAGGGVREYVQKHHAELPELREHYNQCIKLIMHFRNTHLHFASKYIQNQSQLDQANPTAIGTGGTPFMSYLRKHLDETEKFILNDVHA